MKCSRQLTLVCIRGSDNKAHEVFQIKELTVVNDCLKNEWNAVSIPSDRTLSTLAVPAVLAVQTSLFVHQRFLSAFRAGFTLYFGAFGDVAFQRSDYTVFPGVERLVVQV